MTQVVFIGGGNMASSIIGGLIKQGWSAKNIKVAEPSLDQRQHLEKKFGIQTFKQGIDALEAADVVMLAVKPQVMKAVLEPMHSALSQSQPLLISIAAGINLNSLSHWSGCHAIVRCMPNTPALLNLGATGLVANAHTSQAQQEQAQQLLQAIGSTHWVNTEAEIDAVTAVSGSGPAYFFLLMEAMISAGQQLGLDKQTAAALTVQTAIGASQMALEAEEDIAELRRNVTSPGGTTEQAILTFQREGFHEIVFDALEAARNQAEQLSQQFGK